MVKRMISLFLCMTMVFSMLPVQAFAADDVTKPEEIVETEPVEEITVHSEAVTESIEEVTAPTEAVVEPIIEVTESEATIESEQVCTGLVDCPVSDHNDGCTKKAADEKTDEDQAAVDAVMALINAIPSLEEIQVKAQEEQLECYYQVEAAYDAYKALTDSQKAMLETSDEAFDKYFAYFNNFSEEATVLTGTCGENLTWLLDEYGTLTISGIGEMDNYQEEDPPWYLYRNQILSAVIKNGVTSIGREAFWNCKNLSSTTISDTVNAIAAFAFCSCPNLTNILVPSSVVSIGASAFANCSNLTSIIVDEGNPVYCNDLTGTLFNKAKTAIVQVPGAYNGDYIIPSTVTNVQSFSFWGVNNLTGVTIPDSVTFIDSSAFYLCKNLTGVIFEGNAPVFREDVFHLLTLTAYYPAGDDTWTENKLQNYGGTVTWVAYEEKHTHEFGDDHRCECGVSGGICGENLTWIFDPNSGTLTISGTGPMDNYPVLSSPWCSNRNIKTLILEEGVTSVGDAALYQCTNLHTVVFPNSLTSIGKNAFQLCYGLQNIVLPDSLNSIGDFAFSNCTSLSQIDIPDSVAFIGPYALSGCTSLKSITIPDSVTSIGIHAFRSCSALESIMLSKNITTLGEYIFNGCTSLKDITIPENVTHIGERAFGNCKSLKNITIPEKITSIGDYAFENCIMLETFNYNAVKADNLSTGNFVFCKAGTAGDGITVNVGANVMSIPNALFAPSSNLTYAAKIVKVKFAKESVCTSIGDYAFAYGIYLKEIMLPSSLISIGKYAFRNCTELKKIIVDANLITISSYAFYNVVATIYYPISIETEIMELKQNCGGSIIWMPYSNVENEIFISEKELDGETSVWIDGTEYPISTDGSHYYANLPDSNAKTMVTYTYGESNGKPYPIGMKVWMLSNTDGFYTATRVEELDDALLYAGCSIRIDGVQGIRMITSVDQLDKDALTGNGLAGYTLKEYGTAIAWAGQLGSKRPLVLGKSYVNSNYAYKKDEADPIYDDIDGRIYYTNVVVGFTLQQCSKDLAMRPYMILENAEGNDITLYGGIVERSIQYIAAEIMEMDWYSPGDPEYEYLQVIIDAGRLTCKHLETTILDGIEPTCTEAGLTQGARCNNCRLYTLEPVVIAAKGHTVVIDDAIDATCTEAGLTEGKHCSVCSEILIPQEEIVKKEHNFFKQEVIDATETSEGYTLSFCNCGHIQKDNIVPALASLGLAYSIQHNSVLGNICVITGIGTCTDKNVIIPSSIDGAPVKVIDKNAFSNQDHIESVILPYAVNKIEEYAFFDCDNLRQITMPNVLRIGKDAFSRCANLNQVVLPDQLETIGGSAFGGCTSLETIIIPYNVSKIQSHAFQLCDNLTIYCEIDSKPFGWSDTWNFKNYDGSVFEANWNYVREGDTSIRHTFGEWYVEEEGTETQGRTMRRDCQICGEPEYYTFKKIKIYYGGNASEHLTDVSELSCMYSDQKEVTVTIVANTGEYLYYCSPVEYGECTFYVGGFEGGFDFLGKYEVNHEEYYFYRSGQRSLGVCHVYVE